MSRYRPPEATRARRCRCTVAQCRAARDHALMDTGWVVRTFQGRGKGKGASRYVPVINVLELATQGKFPHRPTIPGQLMSRMNRPTPMGHQRPTPMGQLMPNRPTIPGQRLSYLSRGQTRGTSKGTIEVSATLWGWPCGRRCGGFKKVWATYRKLGSKKAAEAAFAAIIDPDVDHITARAGSWAASAKPGRSACRSRCGFLPKSSMRPTGVRCHIYRKSEKARRDANIEEINFEGPLVCVTLKWNDAREGEKETYGTGWRGTSLPRCFASSA